MCLPKPGPRCSGHARARYDAAEAKAAQAEAARAEAARLAADGLLGDESYRDLARAAEAATDFVLKARADYESTPAGQAGLEAKLARTTNGHARKALVRRLDAGRALRAEQVKAWTDRHGEAPAEDAGPDQDDPPIPRRASDSAATAARARVAALTAYADLYAEIAADGDEPDPRAQDRSDRAAALARRLSAEHAPTLRPEDAALVAEAVKRADQDATSMRGDSPSEQDGPVVAGPLAVACPVCKAPPGRPCTARSTGQPMPAPHNVRVRKASASAASPTAARRTGR